MSSTPPSDTQTPASAPATASTSTATTTPALTQMPAPAQPLDAQTRQLAAMAFGEASLQDNSDEMMAIASVLVRQRDARGYSNMATFTKNDPTFSFVIGDGNARYNKLMQATDAQIAKDPAMQAAIAAARNALAGGPDKSNGAYFWDGADIKTNYANHFKVRHGIKITDPSHNIYNIKDSTKLVILYKIIKTKDKKTKKVKTEKIETGRYDHVYDSTAGIGGTIFWKYNQQYLDVTGGSEYR
ncbi:hypothetical protein LFL96_25125 [Paraburkholderia sp. D15]|uniref:hypothetical protein n=1 Tax=Paraburkholderia sp. D15 TaxID=2880218 RepID=UPI002479BD67|nr:hypothetical protein [Paraburkholderia sp. D15]WGS54302.1 hypothetical protein LFL96_25125 [Paraburkholderia sp. D15]